MKKVLLQVVFLLALVYTCTCSAQQSTASQGNNITLPITYHSQAVEGSEQVCGPEILRQRLQAKVDQDLTGLIRNALPALVRCDDRNLGQLQHCPAVSCSDIVTQSPVLRLSGYYWIRSRNGTTLQVYCDMDRRCGCNSFGGWTRVANLNVRNTSQPCPGDWTLQIYSSEPRRLCGRNSSSGRGCLSAVYSTYGIRYSHVCGRVIGYSYRAPEAFGQFAGPQTIEGPYVDGISLTHGPPGTRQHIWSFAAGTSESASVHSNAACPCAHRQSGTIVPSFVGNDYFCESGNPGPSFTSRLYTSDPLWDGQGCGFPSCCELSYPPGVTAPWFCKQLPQATTDDIEVRLCADDGLPSEETPVELIELYIR